MTQSQEDYLEMVSYLSENSGEVRVTDIAARLGFSKPSVSAALKMLEGKELVQHARYGTVLLTDKGRALAAEIRDKHTLLKTFLSDTLGVSEETAEKDACRTEHVLSNETFAKLREFMNKPH